jgi:hypothetical protein
MISDRGFQILEHHSSSPDSYRDQSDKVVESEVFLGDCFVAIGSKANVASQ